MEDWYTALNPEESFSVGIIGAGYVTKKYHAPIVDNLPGTEIEWVADIDFKQAKNVTRLFSGDPVNLSDDPVLPPSDVALLATPVIHRESYLNDLSDSNTPVLCEKPFATSVSEHELFTENNNKVAVNYLRTYFSPIQRLKYLFGSGLLRKPDNIHIQRGTVGGGTGGNSGLYRTNPDAGGVLMERGCHTLSQITHLFGDFDFYVNTACIKQLDGIDVEFSIELIIKGPESEFTIDYRHSTLKNFERGTKLTYPSGNIKFDHLSASDPISFEYKKDQHTWEDIINGNGTRTWAESTQQGHILSWLEFIEYVKHGKHHLGEDPTLPRVTELIEKIRREAETTEINEI